MDTPSRLSCEEELQKICDQNFKNFCQKYGDKSTWVELDPSKTYVPSFYLLGPRYVHSKESIKPSAVKRLDFTCRKPNTQSFSLDFQNNQTRRSSSIQKPDLISQHLNFQVEKPPNPLTEDNTKRDISNSSLIGVNSGKENATNQLASLSKDITSGSVEQPSPKTRFPLDEKLPVSHFIICRL
ncbi:unnamed protein product [Hymenolepis diminuta]|uniref:Uncharacterized protein n=1 Tax=Hymenolepis diminuta TaxID=6216 RepID=A0A564Y6J5_HYMDI|nr:unnamed protein product [Hymenolepis diminuta]